MLCHELGLGAGVVWLIVAGVGCNLAVMGVCVFFERILVVDRRLVLVFI